MLFSTFYKIPNYTLLFHGNVIILPYEIFDKYACVERKMDLYHSRIYDGIGLDLELSTSTTSQYLNIVVLCINSTRTYADA